MEINQLKEETSGFLLTSCSFSFILEHPCCASASQRERLLPLSVGEKCFEEEGVLE